MSESCWKLAVDDALVSACLNTADSYPTPADAIRDLIRWNVQIALDPRVSSDAQALIDLGKKQRKDTP